MALHILIIFLLRQVFSSVSREIVPLPLQLLYVFYELLVFI